MEIKKKLSTSDDINANVVEPSVKQNCGTHEIEF